MFSEVRTRIQSARFQKGDCISPTEVDELKKTAQSLRRQLSQVVDDEIAPNNEACGVAINGMVLLRNELESKKSQRVVLQHMLTKAKSELFHFEKQCIQEKAQKETCREDVIRMQHETETCRKEGINIRAEMKQLKYFQDNIDAETKHRLRADVQNLLLEKERDEIRLRQLRSGRSELESELERLTAERDAMKIVMDTRENELSEANMTREMCAVHHEALSLHYETLGGDPRSMFRGFRSDSIKHSFREFFNGSSSRRLTAPRDDKSIYSKVERQRLKNGASSVVGLQTTRNKMERTTSDRSKSPAAVGGIVLGDGNSEGSSDFMRRAIFKMGGNGSAEIVSEYVTKEERDVEFEPDSHSISAISAITLDEGAWTESESEEPSG